MQTCYDCVHALFDKTVWYGSLMSGWAIRPLCSNHPETPGTMRQAPPGRPCRNFRPAHRGPMRCKPPEPHDERIRYIALTKGKFATVDAADYSKLRRFRWHTKETRGRFYAATVIDGKSVAMHRLLMAPPPGHVVDHVNGNGLDNCRANLRLCTPQQNRHNTRPKRGPSHFIGVYRAGRRFRARIRHDGREYYLGTFDNPIAAARARDQKARELHGPFAWLNFPEENPSP